MTIRYSNNLWPMTRVRNEIDQLMRQFSNVAEPVLHGQALGTPAMNVWEDGERYVAEMELPGLVMEDVEVVVQGDLLSVRGERKAAEPGEGASVHRRERPVGKFVRTLKLGAKIDADAVSATLKDGVLTITMPKAVEARMRKIEVKVS